MTSSYCTSAAADSFTARLLADTDCQAFGMVERGYAILSQPGSSMAAVLTGLLVIAVAFFGYRLLLGRGLALNEAVGLTVKIGVVLIIATSWEAWQALAYQGLARGPTQIAGEMLAAIGASSPLESLENALDSLAVAGVEYRNRAGISSPLVGGPAAAAAVLNLAAIILTLSTVGIIVATRVVLAVLLAIAPAMAGFILFDTTRGMAQGWLGVMVAAAIAPLLVLLVASVEFAILAPMIARLLSEQAAGSFETAAVMPIGLVTIVFAIALIFAVRAGSRIGFGLRLAGRTPATVAPSAAMSPHVAEREPQLLLTGPTPAPRVSRALETLARRDADPGPARIRSLDSPRAISNARDTAPAPVANASAFSFPNQRRSTRMRSASRRSRVAARRDA